MQTLEQQMDRLEREIREVRIEFERFCNGAPGVELPEVERRRARIGAELKALRSSNLKSVELGFRLASLETRFHSYSELFGRRVRRLEEGLAPAPRRFAPEEAGEDDLGDERDFVVEGTVSREAVEALYRRLERRAGGRPRFDLTSFQSYLDRQLESIRARTGCERVAFRIAEEDGKMKLKARPVRA
jgi:hypothetical protein